jgi:hypothetical protein
MSSSWWFAGTSMINIPMADPVYLQAGTWDSLCLYLQPDCQCSGIDHAVAGYHQREMGLDKALFRKMIRYALPLLVVGLAGMVNEVADKILLKHLVSDPGTAMEQLGIYGANFRLAVLMTLFIQMFRYAAEPFFFSSRATPMPGRYMPMYEVFRVVLLTDFSGCIAVYRSFSALYRSFLS